MSAAAAPGGEPRKALQERIAEAFADFDANGTELDAIGRELKERRKRVESHPIAEASRDYAIAADRWITEHAGVAETSDAAVREAMRVLGWDSCLIHAKIMRALDGRDEYPRGAPFEKSAVQSDWNGSAKVAVISLERSENAWRVLSVVNTDARAAELAASLENLRQQMSREFPGALEFRRPGFDDQPTRR
jgi:hypothetical protein